MVLAKTAVIEMLNY